MLPAFLLLKLNFRKPRHFGMLLAGMTVKPSYLIKSIS